MTPNAPPHIIVLSRPGVQTFHGTEPYIVISIRPPDMSPVRLRPDPLRNAHINIACNDAAPEWAHDQTNNVLLTPEQAERIARFITRYPNETIVINCLSGVSRSAGVAVGIRTALGFDTGEFARAPYDPNQHVVRLVHHAITQLRARQQERS